MRTISLVGHVRAIADDRVAFQHPWIMASAAGLNELNLACMFEMAVVYWLSRLRSYQVLSILNALSAHKESLMFMGNVIKCNPNCGIFITMNPGYAGRTELPDNLKVCLRYLALPPPFSPVHAWRHHRTELRKRSPGKNKKGFRFLPAQQRKRVKYAKAGVGDT